MRRLLIAIPLLGCACCGSAETRSPDDTAMTTTRTHKLEITDRTPAVMADDIAIHPTEPGVWVTRSGNAVFLFRGNVDATKELGGSNVYVSGTRGLRFTADGAVLHVGLLRVDFPSLAMRGQGAVSANFKRGLDDPARQEADGYEPALAATCFDPTVTVHSAVWRPVRNKALERKHAPPARLVVFDDAKRDHVADLTPGLVDGDASVLGLACSKRWVVAVGTRVLVWDRADGYELVAPADAGIAPGSQVAIAPDDAALAVAYQGEVRLVDPTTRAVLAKLDAGIGPVTTLAYAPDGAWIAAGGQKGVAVIPTDGKALGEPLHADLGQIEAIAAVTAVAFEPDSKALRAVFVGGPGGAVRLAIR